MNYTPTTWIDGETPVNAENLNKLEQAVAEISRSEGGGDGVGLQMELLWENASHDSEFVPQTIEVDFTGYSHIIVLLKMSITATQHISTFTRVGYNFLLNCEYLEGGTSKRQGIFADNGITFSEGKFNNGTNNKYAIPREIYGVRGVIE